MKAKGNASRSGPHGLAVIVMLIAVGVLLSGCAAAAGEAQNQGIVATYVQGTLMALGTQEALASQIAQTQAAESMPTQTPTLTMTVAPPTETPTATLPPTATATSAPTATPIPGDWAGFIKDVSAPDGTRMDPDESFTKTWRLKNIGSQRWTKQYELVFISGDRMGGKKAIPLLRAVDPGETVDLSVDMIAPLSPGRYKGFWALRDENGRTFGIGPDADDYFWVEIRVVKAITRQAFDFDAAYCDAAWVNASETLGCPGSVDNPAGSVVLVQDPVMEDGKVHNGNALVLRPEWAGRGYIAGTFPAFEVKQGDRLRMHFSCPDDARRCDVFLRINYQIGSRGPETLYELHKTFDRKVSWVDINLSDLAGKNVKFILMVRAGREHVNGDVGMLLNPGIWR